MFSLGLVAGMVVGPIIWLFFIGCWFQRTETVDELIKLGPGEKPTFPASEDLEFLTGSKESWPMKVALFITQQGASLGHWLDVRKYKMLAQSASESH